MTEISRKSHESQHEAGLRGLQMDGGPKALNYVAVTVVKEGDKGEWPALPSIPTLKHSAPDAGFLRRDQKKDPSRVKFLTELRNRAMERALREYPDRTHIVNLESYYLGQQKAILQLVDSYERFFGEAIVGGGVWFRDRSRYPSRVSFYDTWSCPEMDGASYLYFRPSGLKRVTSVGSCLIFPRWVWEKHRFEVPEPFPDAGIYYNHLCKASGLPVYLDLDVRFWRDSTTNPDIRDYPIRRRIRGTLVTLKRRVFNVKAGFLP